MVTLLNQSGINNLLTGAGGAVEDSVYFNTTDQSLVFSTTGSLFSLPPCRQSKHSNLEAEMMTAMGAKYYWNADRLLGTGTWNEENNYRYNETGIITGDFVDNTQGGDNYVTAFYPCGGTGADGLYLKQDTYTEQGYISDSSSSYGYGYGAVYFPAYADHLKFSPTFSASHPLSIVVLVSHSSIMAGVLRLNNAGGFGARYTAGEPQVWGPSQNTLNSNYSKVQSAGMPHKVSPSIYIVTVSGSTTVLRIDGVETHSGDYGWADPTTITEVLSHQQNGAWGGQGSLFELAFFEGKLLSAGEIAALENFYSNKYGISKGFLRSAS